MPGQLLARPVNLARVCGMLRQSDSLAVYNHRSVLGLRVLIHNLSNSSSKFQEGVAERIGMTGPFSIVELDNLPLFTIFPQSNCSNHKICELFVNLNCNPNAPVNLLPIFCRRPVLYTHHSNKVKSPGNHHNTRCFFLPHHPPEVRHGGLGGSLGDNVCLGLDQTLQKWTGILKRMYCKLLLTST